MNRFTSQPIKPAGVGDHPATLQIPSSGISVEASKAQPLRRETRKSMSRRSGQGSKPFPVGKWWRVRARFDVPGVEKRRQRSLKVCLVSERLSMPVIERKAKEVITASGANSEERFDRVVLGEGVTFREQAKIWLQEATTRNRRPIRNITSIQGALKKWISPMIGDMTLSTVDNVTLKPLVKKLVKSGLAPETIRKYVEYVKKVMSSKLAPNGEPLYPRVWNATVMDLPLVVYKAEGEAPGAKGRWHQRIDCSRRIRQRAILVCAVGGDGHADQRGIGSRNETLHQQRSHHRGRATSRKGLPPHRQLFEDRRIVAANRTAS